MTIAKSKIVGEVRCVLATSFRTVVTAESHESALAESYSNSRVRVLIASLRNMRHKGEKGS